MSDIDLFESRVETWIRARAERGVRPFDAAAIARGAIIEAGRLRPWSSLAGGARALRRTPSLVGVLVLVSLVALLATVGELIGSQPHRPTPTTPARLGAFTPAGALDEALETGYFTATALPDGRVLIIGGCGSCATAQLWDSTTMTFTPAGSLPEGRDRHAAALLPDGRVLVLGGYVPPDKSGRHPSVPAELWDPRTLSFSPAGAHGDFALYFPPTATVLPDGRVLIGDVDPADAGTQATFELWDPADGTFQPAGTLPLDTAFYTATGLPDGRVLIVGGMTGDRPSAVAEVWDPGTRSFSPTGSLVEARQEHTATLLADGRVLITGGDSWDSTSSHTLASAEVWDPAADSFSLAGTMSKSRGGHSATLLPNGRVLIVGGQSGHFGPDTGPHGNWRTLASAEVWDPTTNAFSPTGSMSVARAEHTASLLPDGRVFVFGGDRPNGPITDGELWSPR